MTCADGNWSDTNRGSHLTPSYANSAPMASDGSLNAAKNEKLSAFHHLALKHADTILGTPIDAINQTILGGSPNCKPGCLPLCDSTCQWYVKLAGKSTHQKTKNGLTFLCNDDHQSAFVRFEGRGFALAPQSCKLLDESGTVLWDSHSVHGLDTPAPFTSIPNLTPGKLRWETWPANDRGSQKHIGDWYRARFSLPAGAESFQGPNAKTLSVNMSGFGSGHVFFNGFHLGFYNLARGNCSKCPRGGFGCWPDGDYVAGTCGLPTQDCYHVPPEALQAAPNGDAELLVFNSADGSCTPCSDEAGEDTAPTACPKQNNMSPPTAIAPTRASIVMRVPATNK